MGINIWNIFKKKDHKSEVLEMRFNYGETNNKNTQVCSSKVDGKNFLAADHVSCEIQRLQEIQNRTKKQRSKKRLQKRIDAYVKAGGAMNG
ncbi:hypothetical protein F4V43_02100 [Paenibacillus spiritus]|uniref:Uncharacterized protein n=1 Tax=Paenibacillus spiritus TaxID=2496557 RepID=A0A5J5GGM0_9BACL|nr:hypothetical protein [Paenibacillus spiritus]KAA9007301.1 hypothetical protein F4V43_02100 [Paenibacillus spiritus]